MGPGFSRVIPPQKKQNKKQVPMSLWMCSHLHLDLWPSLWFPPKNSFYKQTLPTVQHNERTQLTPPTHFLVPDDIIPDIISFVNTGSGSLWHYRLRFQTMREQEWVCTVYVHIFIVSHRDDVHLFVLQINKKLPNALRLSVPAAISSCLLGKVQRFQKHVWDSNPEPLCNTTAQPRSSVLLGGGGCFLYYSMVLFLSTEDIP